MGLQIVGPLNGIESAALIGEGGRIEQDIKRLEHVLGSLSKSTENTQMEIARLKSRKQIMLVDIATLRGVDITGKSLKERVNGDGTVVIALSRSVAAGSNTALEAAMTTNAVSAVLTLWVPLTPTSRAAPTPTPRANSRPATLGRARSSTRTPASCRPVRTLVHPGAAPTTTRRTITVIMCMMRSRTEFRSRTLT